MNCNYDLLPFPKFFFEGFQTNWEAKILYVGVAVAKELTPHPQ